MKNRLQTLHLKVDAFSTRNAVHQFQQRRLLVTCQAVVVLNFQERKSRSPTVRDEHRPIGRSQLSGFNYGELWLALASASRDQAPTFCRSHS
jgi:hypothetical protein